MFDYPFRVPARFALIIRAVVSQEGLALRLDPNFKIIRIAYPYVAKRLLTGDTKEMLEILLGVIFDRNGNLRLDRLESLLQVLVNDSEESGQELLPIAGASFKLLVSSKGAILRRNLLMTLINDDRLSARELKDLVKLLRRSFRVRKMAGEIVKTPGTA